MKKTTLLGLVTATLALSTFAVADEVKTPKLTPPPPYASLPTGTFSAPPKDKAPKTIPKTEKVEGFYVAETPKNQIRPGEKQTQVLIFSKQDEAKEYASGEGGFHNQTDDTLCFSQTERRFSPDAEVATEWPLEMEPTSRINAPYKPYVPAKKGEKPKPYSMNFGPMEVTAIHQERFSMEDKKAKIESIDAWVDPNTKGVRLISRQTTTLDRIGSAFNGIRLFAARGDKSLHIVARREKPKNLNGSPPTTSRDFRMMNASGQPLMVELPDGRTDATQCGFAHITMKAAAGSAEIASFQTSAVFVDPVDPKKEPVKPPEDSLGGFEREDDGPTVRSRPFRATVSSTWASKDKEPQISVSFGWVGREREM